LICNDNKAIAQADVLNGTLAQLPDKLKFYSENAVVWDSVMRVAGYSETNQAVGLEEIRKFYTWLSHLPPIKVELNSIFGEGDKVAVEWTLYGENAAGKFSIPCVNIYDFEDRKIMGVRMQFDSAYFADIIRRNTT